MTSDNMRYEYLASYIVQVHAWTSLLPEVIAILALGVTKPLLESSTDELIDVNRGSCGCDPI